jgi:hypothetical protein
MDYEWNTSTLVLLRPLSSSSEPSSPTEPSWDMIKPIETTRQAPAQSGTSHNQPSVIEREKPPPSVIVREMPPDPRLISSPPPPKRKVASLPKPVPVMQAAVVDTAHKEHEELYNKEVEIKAPLSPRAMNSVAPFGKLASKMKLMLRRRSTAEEKQEKQEKKKKEKEKEKEKDYYDPVEDVHWSEY